MFVSFDSTELAARFYVCGKLLWKDSLSGLLKFEYLLSHNKPVELFGFGLSVAPFLTRLFKVLWYSTVKFHAVVMFCEAVKVVVVVGACLIVN